METARSTDRHVRKALTALLAAVLLSLLAALPALALEKPSVACQGAALYNATTGEFLFEKNGDQQFFPASITKLMTALLVLENCGQDEIVTFSKTATTNLEAGAVGLDVVEGDQISVRDCLFGLLLKSANEVANGLAEHVSGSVPAFADLMNERARQLGCTHTNFVNPNGLNNSSHLTTAKDMCLIGAACFKNPAFLEIDKNTTYHFPATKNRPNGTTITMGHKMISPTGGQHYAGILGGKTGYTSKAGNTLVTGVERDGVLLVAVVLRSQATHYADTRAMLNYGFALEAEKREALGTTGESEAGAPGAEASPAGTEIPGDGTGAAQDPAGDSSVKGPGVPSSGQAPVEGENPGPGAGSTVDTSGKVTAAGDGNSAEASSAAESAAAETVPAESAAPAGNDAPEPKESEAGPGETSGGKPGPGTEGQNGIVSGPPEGE